MGNTVTQDHAEIPASVIRQAEEDDRRQEAEIASMKIAAAVRPAQDVVKPVESNPVPVQQAVMPASGDSNLSSEIAEMKRLLALERQRNQTLQGRIDAIGPQTAEALRELRAQNADLQRKMEAVTPKVPPHLAHLTPEEQEVYADGKLPPEVRMAQGHIDAATAQLRAENAKLLARLERLEQGSSSEQMDRHTQVVMQSVEKLLPGASNINMDHDFIQWLDNSDPRSTIGSTYRERGSEAMERGDSYAIAELMKEYLNQGSHIDPRINAQIRPDATTVIPSITPSQVLMVSQSEAEQFYQDKARGRCTNPDGTPMTAAEIAETERIIDLAIKENRIVAG